ncbi:glutathione S-transferase N-terminal domain-containing protein [Hoeflea sp. TYP-13]|uniref:glutathione S-transferase N-terminal domain-containing protein n=1 Tax=Hoeflea sp. TYP-13 TaxID=3230023 RepID=UPI0034C64ECD
MKLYSAPGTCATAMHIALEWAGAPFEVEHLDFQGMKSPEYLMLNPAGVVPTLVADGTAMAEGAAILLYLTDRFPQAGLGPQNGRRRPSGATPLAGVPEWHIASLFLASFHADAVYDRRKRL